ncbi:MAG: TatD family hydrolase [Methanobacteriaceae archaeon]|nr:TatD family hydrolase [Methanobacteriaceae archaeon]
MKEVFVTDNHIHVDPYNGDGPVIVAKKFERSGGNVMIIPNKPTWTISETCTYKEAMDLVINYTKEINDNTSIKAYPIVGVHPAELSRLIRNRVSLPIAEEKIQDALKTAYKLVEDGEAIGIGEIGRPHYQVSSEELKIHNNLIKYVMDLAHDADCAVQLHTETATKKEFEEFAKMATESNLKSYKVIKHFSGPYVDEKENYGLTPSLIATKNVILEGIKKGNRFLMETDYLDDLSRPGAVLGPKTVPRRTNDLIRKGILSIDDANKIHVDNVEKVYGIDLDF